MLRTSVTVSHFLTQKPLKPWEKEDARQMLSGAMPKKGAKVNLAGYFDTLRLPNRKWCFHVLSFVLVEACGESFHMLQSGG